VLHRILVATSGCHGLFIGNVAKRSPPAKEFDTSEIVATRQLTDVAFDRRRGTSAESTCVAPKLAL
jgi:hypothetical protein